MTPQRRRRLLEASRLGRTVLGAGPADFAAPAGAQGDLDPDGRWRTVSGNKIHITAAGEIDAGGPPVLRDILAEKAGLKAKGAAAATPDPAAAKTPAPKPSPIPWMANLKRPGGGENSHEGTPPSKPGPDHNPQNFDGSLARPKILNAILSRMGRSDPSPLAPRPKLTDLYEAAREADPELGVREFQNALFRLHADGRVALGAWTLAPAALPADLSKLVMPLDRETKAYAEARDLTPYPDGGKGAKKDRPAAPPAPPPRS